MAKAQKKRKERIVHKWKERHKDFVKIYETGQHKNLSFKFSFYIQVPAHFSSSAMKYKYCHQENAACRWRPRSRLPSRPPAWRTRALIIFKCELKLIRVQVFTYAHRATIITISLSPC